MTEKQFENLVLSYLHNCGIMCWKNQSRGLFNPKKNRFIKNPSARNGIPDISFVVRGTTFYAELKRPAKKPRTPDQLWKMCSIDQKSFIADLRESGAIAIVTDSIENFRMQLKNYGVYLP